MSNPPWMPLNIDDYLADTAHLSAAEHGAYMLLIMRYWKDGGLPEDERMIARFSRLSPEQWADSRDLLASFFENGWRHKRIDAELAKAAEIIGKRKAAADHRHSKSNAHADQVQSKSTHTGVPPSPVTETTSLRSEEKEVRAKRAARLPEDWSLPSEWRQDAIDAGLSPGRVDTEAAKMLDWSRSAPQGAKVDWRSAWRNWCRRQVDETPKARGSPAQNRRPAPIDHFRNFASEIDGQNRDERGPSGDWDDAPGLPLRTIEHHG